MTAYLKGMAVAVLHLCLVASLGGKLLYDRASLPSVWALTTPHDPDLPIRGRYVSLDLVVEPRDVKQAEASPGWQSPQGVVLRVEAGRLVVYPMPAARGYDPSSSRIRFTQREGKKLAVLDTPVPFFIPEHVPDPSRRAPGEELWVEVTVPGTGPPRPIRLGVKKGNGPILPLDLS